jgi:hypothetical protein
MNNDFIPLLELLVCNVITLKFHETSTNRSLATKTENKIKIIYLK